MFVDLNWLLRCVCGFGLYVLMWLPWHVRFEKRRHRWVVCGASILLIFGLIHIPLRAETSAPVVKVKSEWGR